MNGRGRCRSKHAGEPRAFDQRTTIHCTSSIRGVLENPPADLRFRAPRRKPTAGSIDAFVTVRHEGARPGSELATCSIGYPDQPPPAIVGRCPDADGARRDLLGVVVVGIED